MKEGSLETRRFGQVDAEPVAAARVAAGHLGAAGQTGAQAVAYFDLAPAGLASQGDQRTTV